MIYTQLRPQRTLRRRLFVKRNPLDPFPVPYVDVTLGHCQRRLFETNVEPKFTLIIDLTSSLTRSVQPSTQSQEKRTSVYTSTPGYLMWT